MKNARTLPEWARSLVPVGMDEAATLLGVSRRFLVETLKQHPHYERRGSKKVFYQEHIALLREVMTNLASSLKPETAPTTPLGRSAETAYDRALALATRKSPKRPQD